MLSVHRDFSTPTSIIVVILLGPETVKVIHFGWSAMFLITMHHSGMPNGHIILRAHTICCSNCQTWLATEYNHMHLSANRIFSKDRCLNQCNISFVKFQVEDCLELNSKCVDYQTLAHLSCNSYVCWNSGRATRAQRFEHQLVPLGNSSPSPRLPQIYTFILILFLLVLFFLDMICCILCQYRISAKLNYIERCG